MDESTIEVSDSGIFGIDIEYTWDSGTDVKSKL